MIQISLKSIPKGLINNESASVQVKMLPPEFSWNQVFLEIHSGWVWYDTVFTAGTEMWTLHKSKVNIFIFHIHLYLYGPDYWHLYMWERQQPAYVPQTSSLVPIPEMNGPFNSNLHWNAFVYDILSVKAACLKNNFCTYQDSCTVLLCAKFSSDWIIAQTKTAQ